MWRARHFVPDGAGGFRPQLRRLERAILADLPGRTLALVDQGHPATGRLFPAAYPEDPQADAEYRRATLDELLESRRVALRTLQEGLGKKSIGAEELEIWVAAFETLRLVLGTQLQVEEDMELPPPEDPRAAPFALYQFLSLLQDEAVQALTGLLPEEGREDVVS